jgi:aerobic carbon-monoxide dehydrogenase large subunit
MDDRRASRSEVGAPVRRIEDRALLTGGGRFLDDIAPPGTLAAYVLRSTASHARFTLSGVEAARAHPGVHLVLTIDDVPELGPMPVRLTSKQPDGSAVVPPPHPVLAREVVRYVGEPIAFVVADDARIARDATELIEVAYDPLSPVVSGRAALEDGAPLLRPERGTNLAYEYHLGNESKTEAAFAAAARVVRVHVVNNRVSAAYMETRGVIAEYDRAGSRYTVTAGTQGGQVVRRMLAENLLKVDAARVRVLTPDVGGAFGVKMFTYPEYPLACVAAERLSRSVKWVADRIDHFLADNHGRDMDSIAEMAMDAQGRFRALRIDTVANIGAYCSEMGGWVSFAGAKMATGCYDIPAFFTRVRGVYTNTMTVDAYRGAGRPESAYLIERLVDVCALESGLGPVAIRELNFIKPGQMPHRTATGWTYDTGDFAGHLGRALELAEHADFAARAAGAAAGGKLRGFGMAAHIDACAPPGAETATLRLDGDGGVTLMIGTQTGGHGHATSYAQFVVSAVGVAYKKVRLIQGDTDANPKGGGTGGSRSMPLGAPSVNAAAHLLADKIKAVASGLLEAAPADLELVSGQVRVAGTDRAVRLAAVAAAAELTASEGIEVKERTFPNGTHVAEVEIDPDTGATRIVRYVVVDDLGFVVNPLLLAGQIHGGVAQGIGQALHEQVRYDEGGQLLTASFLDYTIPRADDLPDFAFETRNVLGTTNPLGIKGAGEAGCMGSCPAVMNAIVDALRRAGVSASIDMPATPEKVWRTLHPLAPRFGGEREGPAS